MSVHCLMEIEDIHRWLPQAILEDIDVANPEELRIMVVVEELGTRSMELEDIHRWLPQEIVEDIDIANTEELRIMVGTRLSSVLGSTNIRVQCHTLPPKRLGSSYMPQCPAQLQLIGLQSWDHVTSYGNLPRGQHRSHY
ncbi:unnamed protein product [Urochloa humidicola]